MNFKIIKESKHLYNIVISEGQDMIVSLGESKVSIYIQSQGTRNTLFGRHFTSCSTEKSFYEAIEAYKPTNVKNALRGLLAIVAE